VGVCWPESLGLIITGAVFQNLLDIAFACVPMQMQACGRPTHTIGLHYFNPVQLMQLVEVVCTPEVNEDVIKTAFAFVEQTKKVAVRCKDTPGFIVNRLLIPYLMQASAFLGRASFLSDSA
jgi:3-hydroxyacyl-CoA dehydrogenase